MPSLQVAGIYMFDCACGCLWGNFRAERRILRFVVESVVRMILPKNDVHETLYDVLSVKEDAGEQEIHLAYRRALLSCHPDKLQNSTSLSNSVEESKDQFLKVQKAREILGNPRSKALYDNELRASRSDVIVADEVGIEDMMAGDNGGSIELYHQCRCGDYFSVSCSELEEMGYQLVRDDHQILVRILDKKPGSVILPCASCSLNIHLLIIGNTRVQVDDASGKNMTGT